MSKEKLVIEEYIRRARAAQAIAETFSQRRVDELAAAIVYSMSRENVAKKIAESAFAETNMGSLDAKVDKLDKKMPHILYSILKEKTVGVLEEMPELGLIKIGKAAGVIGALIPSTNPEGTPMFNGVLGLRGRNAVIFSAHPKSHNTTKLVVDLMREVLRINGAPEDLFICTEESSKLISKELMSACDLVMATGSSNKVREAYSSGTPAYGVGVGNAVIVVDETADLEETALKIRIGKTKDNASGCSAENSLVVHESIYDDFIKKLQAQGGYLTNAEEKQKVKNALWINGKINGDIVAKPVDHIAKIAGIELPPSSAFIMVEETDGSSESLFSHEKLSLVLTIYKYSDFDEAVQMVNTIHSHCGSGHSCGIHSNNQEHILKLALNTKTVKVLVRQPHGISNGGAWHNGLAPTFSNSCGTWGGNIASENITQKHFINTTWLSFPLDRKPGSDQEIYQDLLDNVKLL